MVTSLLADARRLAGQNRPEAARDVAQLLLKLNPAAGSAYDLLAEIAYRHGDPTDAAATLKTWHAVSPTNPMPLARLAALAAVDHRPGEALALARQALEHVQGNKRLPYLLLAAKLALAAGKPTDSLTLFDECLELAPEHPIALAGRDGYGVDQWRFRGSSGLPIAWRMSRRKIRGTTIWPAPRPFSPDIWTKPKFRPSMPRPTRPPPRRAGICWRSSAIAATIRRGPPICCVMPRSPAGRRPIMPSLSEVRLRGAAAIMPRRIRCWQGLSAARLKTWNLATLLGGTAFLAGVQACGPATRKMQRIGCGRRPGSGMPIHGWIAC